MKNLLNTLITVAKGALVLFLVFVIVWLFLAFGA